VDEFASFPTPLALIAQRRFHTAPNDFHQRFENALLLGEAAIKWLAATGVSLLTPHNPTAAHAVAYDLVRADGIGEWVTQLNLLARRLHRCPTTQSRHLAKFLTAKCAKNDETPPSPWPAAQHLSEIVRLLDSPDFEESGKHRKSFIDLFADFAFLRNRTRGHGAKTPSFYEQTSDRAEKLACHICEHLQFPFYWAAVLRADQTDSADALKLTGSSPSEHVKVQAHGAADSNTLYIADETGRTLPCARLVRYRSARRSFLFANGAWREASLKGQFVDYVTGDIDDIHVPEFGGPRPAQPDSHTAGSTLLSYTHAAMHNLPRQVGGYITRSALEQDLDALLRDHVHRILTLKGPGGIGKTSLALRVLHRLVEVPDCPFEVVLWLSARDVDLLLEGPAARKRAVTSVDNIAQLFVQLLELGCGEDNMRAVFVDHISGARGAEAILLVIDNFETLDDPEGTHRFLDSHVVLPSKLLITSRHKTYRGDFPIDVQGMEEAEARQLLTAEARANLCEPRMTAQTIGRIIALTGAAPYAMKIVVGHLARTSAPFDPSLGRVLGRDDVLDALFDRSYRVLSNDGQFFYHLLGELRKPTPEVVMSGLMAGVGLDYFEAAEEACGLSLVQATEDEDGQRLYLLPYAAQFHASRELVGHADEVRIRQEAESVRGLIHPQDKSTIVDKFFDAALRKLAGAANLADEKGKLLSLCERCAASEPRRWLLLARHLQGKVPAGALRQYFQKAVQADPLAAAMWREWAEFEKDGGDEVQAVYKGIRAIDLGDTDIYFVSRIAGELLRVLRRPEMKDQFPPHRRAALCGAVRHQMERFRAASKLNSDGLGKLGWLYLNEYSPQSDPQCELVHKAKACAEEGLRLENGHEHCHALYEKCGATLAGA